MILDDPSKPEFASWRSYQEFARRVRHTRRYVWDTEIRSFLDTLLATLKDRDAILQQGRIMYRAQRGIDHDSVKDDAGNEVGEEPHGFGAERMKPLANRAREGRVNPAGIPVLYLASSEQTAICEVRPWVGSEVSVAQFRLLRDLKAVNLSLRHGEAPVGHLTIEQLIGTTPLDVMTKEKAVWIDIDNAFSQPITVSDDAADYVPTQVLAELFRHVGYDAVIYRSQFGEKGYNIAVFDITAAEAINCAPYKIAGIEVRYNEIGNRWFSTKHLERKN